MNEPKKERQAVIVIKITDAGGYINLQNEGYKIMELNGILHDIVSRNVLFTLKPPEPTKFTA
jgi:hypothetical protein